MNINTMQHCSFKPYVLVLGAFLYVSVSTCFAGDETLLIDRVEHHYIDHEGHNIHYVSIGEGPVLLFVHGAPDFWYLWHEQMKTLCEDHRCIAMDTRGYNRSGKPVDMESYAMDFLMSDIDAVIDDAGGIDVTLIAHDFGGLIAWNFAADERYKSRADRLVIINITHPRGFTRTLATQTPEQAKGTAYARVLVDPAQEEATINLLNGAIKLRMETWWNDKDVRIVAFVNEANARTSAASIARYYQANYPREPYTEITDLPQIKIPVLQIHGLADLAVYKDGLADTWDWINADYTLVTYPGVGHIPQLEVPDKVTKTIRAWLTTH